MIEFHRTQLALSCASLIPRDPILGSHCVSASVTFAIRCVRRDDRDTLGPTSRNALVECATSVQVVVGKPGAPLRTSLLPVLPIVVTVLGTPFSRLRINVSVSLAIELLSIAGVELLEARMPVVDTVGATMGCSGCNGSRLSWDV